MEGKWTKGPWVLVDERDLMDEPRWAIKGADGKWVLSGYFHTSTPREANARLIAQAPAMAEALEKALFHFGQYPTGSVEESVDEGALAERIRALLTAIKGE